MTARTVRWKLLLWPVAGLCALAGLLVAVVWGVEVSQRQDRVVYTMLVLGVGSLLLLLWIPIWIVAFSQLRPLVRTAGLAGFGLLAAFAGYALAPAGFSGDVVPLFRWRWARPAGDLAVESPRAARAGRALAGPHDWPGFLGARRDGVVRGVNLATDWSTAPRERWRRPVGAGWSGFAIAGDFAVTQEQRGAQELVTAYDLETGEPLWSHGENTRLEDEIGGPGPRATPSIDGGRVYALGGTGRLVALDLASGRPIWSRQVLVDHRASAPMYGVAASPLVVDGRLVVVAAGGADGHSLAAYDAATGEPVWAAGDAPAAYSSPMLVELAGVPQIVLLNGVGLVGHDPATGAVLWHRDWPPVEKASQPVVLPLDRLFVSTGYGVGGKLLVLERAASGALTLDLVWESLALKAKFTNVVFHEDHLYGLDDGILACVDVRDGSRRWKAGRHGHGQVLLVGRLLLVVGERGTVTLVEASPDAHREFGSFAALEGKTWNHPALAGRWLVVRNDREAACFELPPAAESDSRRG